MSQRVSALLASLVAAFACSAGEANAEGLISEVRFAVLDHDTGLVGSSKEDGVDLGAEVLSQPITQLHFIGSPRVVLGGLLNTEGETNQIYAGLVGQWDFASDVFRQGDGFFLEGMVGGTWHDGETDVTGTPEDANHKSHGSHLLFRTGFGAGYRFNERWSLSAGFHHISNANFEQPNQGANDIGLRLGVRL